ncbi:MAG: hypothetical protein KKH74_01475 [Gammaproteobacteria bacterium]|nr:hypothetical protein [Gammaproteobacteria bacterium]MBU1732494.1 hypothetical protein [Gammaproteobacteria bacterium]MBU1892630.1 hypothetical protein [Gammaproteobacteria bacterium]
MRRNTTRTTAYRLLIAIAAVEQSERVLRDTIADLSELMQGEADPTSDPLWDEVRARLQRLSYRTAAAQPQAIAG